jgi:hypothetical protein
MTSPLAVIDDIVVVGSAIDDNGRVNMPAGVVRAFDARSGALRGSWDPIPPNSTSSANSAKPWKTGAANAWTIMAVDPERDLVFVPTGSASPDYYGGLRTGDDKWADSVVALHAKTREMAWGFQLVHHNLWDYDTASPPLLATLPHNGLKVPVVIQSNKTGFHICFESRHWRPSLSRRGALGATEVTYPAKLPLQLSRYRSRRMRLLRSSFHLMTPGVSRRKIGRPVANGCLGCGAMESSLHPLCKTLWHIQELSAALTERLRLRSAKLLAVREYEQLSFQSQADSF